MRIEWEQTKDHRVWVGYENHRVRWVGRLISNEPLGAILRDGNTRIRI